MKILLAKPKAPNKLSFLKILDSEPLELEYLHTVAMQEGYQDYIYDGLTEEESFATVLRREKPDILAVTGYISQEELMLKYCHLAKKQNPNIITLIGGVHAQLNHQRFYHSHVDYVVRSQGMDDFAALLCYFKGDRVNLSAINGLCHRTSDSVYEENPLKPVDINALPIPDRSHFHKNIHQYRYLDLEGIASIRTALSCPYQCEFCYCRLLNNGQYQVRDMDKVIEELLTIHASNIQIVDDDFLVSEKRVEEFLDGLERHNIRKTFVCYGRADFIARHPGLIQRMAEAGFKYFLVGLEAVEDAQLEAYDKQTTAQDNVSAVQVIREAGAICVALMIVGLDAEQKDFDQLVDWVCRHNLDYVTVSMFTPIPGTVLYDRYKDRLMTEDMTHWDFLHLVVPPEKLSVKEFYAAYYKMVMKLYRRAKKSGAYDFMDMGFYINMLGGYLKTKIKGL